MIPYHKLTYASIISIHPSIHPSCIFKASSTSPNNKQATNSKHYIFMFTFESLIDDSLFASEGFCSSSSLLPTGDSPGQTSAAFVASPSSSCDNEGSFSSASTAYTTAAAGSPASSPPFAALAQDPLKLAASLSSHHQLQLQEEEQACLRSSGKMTSSGVSELDPQQPFFENSLPTPPLSSTASPPSPTYFSLPQSCTPLTSSSSSTSTTGGPLESGANEVMDLTCLMVDSSSASHRNNSNAFAWDDTPLRLDLNSIDPASMVSSVVDSTSAMSLGLDPSLVFGTAPMDLTTDASSIMPNLDMVMSMAANTASTDIHHLLQLQPMEPSLNFLSASPSQLLKNPQHHHVILPSQAKQSPGKMQIVKREDGKNIVKRSLKSSVDLRQKVLTAAKKASASKMQCVDDDDDIDADLDDDMEEDEVRRAARVRLSSFLESDETPLSSGIPFSTTTTASQFPSISAACSASIATWPLPSSRVLQDKDARKRSRTGSVSSHPTSRLQVLTGLALHTPAASPLAVTGCPPNFFQQQMSMTVSGTVSPTSPTDASFPMKREEDEDEDDESDESDAEDAPAGGHVAVPIRCVQVSPPPDPITPPSDDVIDDEEEGDGKDYYPPITYSRNLALVEGGAGGQGRKGSVSKVSVVCLFSFVA
ncbi:hypothetical protein BC829DRAFT_387003 [Chytridium lagenaria]|nr:hypothetical protein BC829DRAFT_387003 [Chytridium lagenaria]